jgi:hypothetical protein
MAHTKEQIERLDKWADKLDELRTDLSNDAVFVNLLYGILTKDDGAAIRKALKSFEGDDPPLRDEILAVMQHPKLKPFLPH